jgi:hypothetical protein
MDTLAPIPADEFEALAVDLTTHSFYCFRLSQPLVFVWGKWLEHTHFTPGTRWHTLLNFNVVRWRAEIYVVGDAHYLCDGIISESARQFGLEIVPGGPDGFPGSQIGDRMRRVVYLGDCACRDYREREYKIVARFVCQKVELSPQRIVEYVCHGR